MAQLEISYKIYLEADDITQSRIHSSIAFVDDESDMDAFMLRFYVEQDIREETCSSPDDADAFVLDMAEFLDAIAAAHSFLDMEGSFSWSFHGEKKFYQFRSESGQDYCDFAEQDGIRS